MKKISFSIPVILVAFMLSFSFGSCLPKKSQEILDNQGTGSEEANSLARKILKVLKKDAYDRTKYINWEFLGKRFYNFEGNVFYHWDKEENIVEMKWKDTKVILHPHKLEKSKLFINDSLVKDNKKTIKIANDLFNNDSFWLVAPYKLFDEGTIRSIVSIDGKKALRVKYTKGGTTPGDSYIWVLNKDFLPVKYLMDVPSMNLIKVIATWEKWKITESGILLPRLHVFSDKSELSMGEIRGYN